jgi:glutathione S-transferase
MIESNSDQNQIILGYWAIRGLAEPSRITLHYTKTPFINKTYEQGDAPDYRRDEWLNEKQKLGLDFPNLPYLIHGNLKITQSKAILYYLGRKFNLMGMNLKEQAYVFMLCEEVHDLRLKYGGFCNGPNGDSETERKKFIETILVEYLKKIDQYLQKSTSKFIIGNQPTVADFQVFEYLDACLYLDNEQILLDKYSNIKQFLNTIRNLPELKDYITKTHNQVPLHNRGRSIRSVEMYFKIFIFSRQIRWKSNRTKRSSLD